MKQKTGTVSIEQLKLLHSIGNRFGDEWQMKKINLLEALADLKIDNPSNLIAYHDCLLFLLAYPETRNLYHLARRELERVAAIAHHIYEGSHEKYRTQLTGSGIANTASNVAFGLDLVTWLVHKFPEQVNIFDCGCSATTLKETMMLLLPEAERGAFENEEYSLERFSKIAIGKNELTPLQWLTGLFQQQHIMPAVKDQLYDSLKIYVTLFTTRPAPSRTYARLPQDRIFFHKRPLIKKPVAAKVISMPLLKAVKIGQVEKEQLLTAARGILCMLQRETDPVSYADWKGIRYFEMGRGIAIALFPMSAERRLPFDSYIGFVLFKNGLPVAYGGGWIFQQRCKIGINVLEPFRGGESAWLFLQVLRLYHHRYKVHRFVVEPYQIGHKNPEGLHSGAFWFYYRLGFRPVEIKLKALADDEFDKISLEKDYRTSYAILKKLAASDMEWVLAEEANHQIDAFSCSEAIRKMIQTRFAANRQQAIVAAFQRATVFLRINLKPEISFAWKKTIENFGMLLMALNIDEEKWTGRDRLALLKLMKEKGMGDEEQYILLFQRHRRLNLELNHIFDPAWNNHK